MSDFVNIRIKHNHLGQIYDGLLVLLEQWEATREYMKSGKFPDDLIIRECTDLEEAEWACNTYREIEQAVAKLLDARREKRTS